MLHACEERHLSIFCISKTSWVPTVFYNLSRNVSARNGNLITMVRGEITQLYVNYRHVAYVHACLVHHQNSQNSEKITSFALQVEFTEHMNV